MFDKLQFGIYVELRNLSNKILKIFYTIFIKNQDVLLRVSIPSIFVQDTEKCLTPWIIYL